MRVRRPLDALDRRSWFGTGRDAWRGLLGRAAVLALVAVLAAPLVAPPALAQRSAVTGATIDQILDNPNQFYGETVRVGGEVDEMLGPRSFTLEDADLMFDEEIPVVAMQPLVDSRGQAIEPDALGSHQVWVTGTVHQVNIGAFEGQFGVNLDDSAWQSWRGRPAIVATSVMYAPAHPAALSPAAPGARGVPGILDYDRFVTVDAIADNPTAYVGQTVLVNGEVEDVSDTRGGVWAFAIEDTDLLFDEQILVIGAAPSASRMGQTTGDQGVAAATAVDDLDGRFVWVSGTVRLFDVAEAESQLGVQLDAARFSSWVGRPAIVAQSLSIAPAYPYPYGPAYGPTDPNRPASSTTP